MKASCSALLSTIITHRSFLLQARGSLTNRRRVLPILIADSIQIAIYCP